MNGDSKELISIAIDAMGGDNAPQSEIAGALEAIQENDDIHIILVGNEAVIQKELKKHLLYDKKKISIHHCREVIEMKESPTEALKKKQDSSILVGLRLQKEKKADAFISIGNTGAVMAATLLTLGRIANVSRPTIGESFPTDEGLSIVLDIGANVDCKPVHLLEFAIMGVVYATHVFGVTNPRVALLNVGEEETKGDTLASEAYQLLKKSNINFIGNIEGGDILRGKAEVIVCDGFVGNVILKFTESIMTVLKNKFTKYASEGIYHKMQVDMMYGILKRILKDFDYEEYGGVPLLGVNGISFIGHGSSSPKAIKTMITKVKRMYRAQINEEIQSKIKDIKEFTLK